MRPAITVSSQSGVRRRGSGVGWWVKRAGIVGAVALGVCAAG